MSIEPFFRSIVDAFDVAGAVEGIAPHGAGHIHESFGVLAGGRRYLLQKLNGRIFRDIPALMENVVRVTDHLAPREIAPRLLRTRAGQSAHRDAAGTWWRMFEFVEHTCAVEIVETPDQAEAAARAFGRFQRELLDLPGPRLREILPDFHHTPKRWKRLEAAVARDPADRAASCRAELDFLRAVQPDFAVLEDLRSSGTIPERVTHNDTKINNVLLDIRTGEARCVVDLDTVMPGLSLHDFGDLVRSACNPAAEDEPDVTKVSFSRPVFTALTRGYLAETRAFLTRTERGLLAFAGRLITLECGIRFLTDHLEGDVYFKIHRPHHNLDRARTQFKLAQDMIDLHSELETIVQRMWIQLAP